MKKIDELKANLEELKVEAQTLLNANNVVDAKAKMEEVKALKEAITLQEQLDEEEIKEVKNKVEKEDKMEKKEVRNEVKDFINGVRVKFTNKMSEGVPGDGGYTVPQDIQTKINELRESKDALESLITVEKVSILEGSRVFKARTQQTGFVEVDEEGTISEKSTPVFTNMAYKCKKYAGFFKATNELLADSDQAIEATLVKWIGDESRVTRNKLILAELDKKAKVAIADVNGIKDIINVSLDPAFKSTAVVVTNQDGFNFLDKLKDADGNYLLQPSISAASGKQLLGLNVQVVSNKDLPSVAGKAPFICGDLKEAIVMFDRKKCEIAATATGGDAFLTDVTMFRAIEREVVKTRDEEAFVYGQITVGSTKSK